MRVLVTGSRDWDDRFKLFHALDELNMTAHIDEIVEGCARGADRLAEQWAVRTPNVKLSHFPADWKHLGRGAGPIRNRRMILTQPDLVVAFHPNISESKGTKDMVAVAVANGVPVMCVT